MFVRDDSRHWPKRPNPKTWYNAILPFEGLNRSGQCMTAFDRYFTASPAKFTITLGKIPKQSIPAMQA